MKNLLKTITVIILPAFIFSCAGTPENSKPALSVLVDTESEAGLAAKREAERAEAERIRLEAERQREEETRLLQEKIDTLYNTGLENLRDARFPLAIEAFSSVIDLDPAFVPAYAHLAMTYYKMNDYSNAGRYFEKTIELDPDYADAYIYLGKIAESEQEYQKAINVYTRLLELKPDNADALLGLGSVYNTVNMNEKSLEYMDSAIATLVKQNSGETGKAFYIQGMNYYALGDYQNAYSLLSAIEDYYGSEKSLAAALRDIRKKLDSGNSGE